MSAHGMRDFLELDLTKLVDGEFRVALICSRNKQDMLQLSVIDNHRNNKWPWFSLDFNTSEDPQVTKMCLFTKSIEGSWFKNIFHLVEQIRLNSPAW